MGLIKSIPISDADETGLRKSEVESGLKTFHVKKTALIKNIQKKMGNLRVSPQRHGGETNYLYVARETSPETVVTMERPIPANTLLKTVDRSPSPHFMQEDLADQPKNFIGM